jgi:hypothetical protein
MRLVESDGRQKCQHSSLTLHIKSQMKCIDLPPNTNFIVALPRVQLGTIQ